MAGNDRYLRNSSSVQQQSNPQQELIASLTAITSNCPPSHNGKYSNRVKGLFSGPTSIAYLFFKVSATHPDLRIEGHTPREWCLAYLDCGSDKLSHADGLAGWGIRNEFLAYNAVKAAATKDYSAVTKLVNAITVECGNCPPADNEFLAGRAGTLALLRIVRKYMPETAEKAVASCMQSLIKHILEHAPWSYHGKSYIGAAHGVIGIITQLVLSDHKLGRNEIIEEQLLELLDLQGPDGHWPTTTSPNRGNQELVQFCHGSPGFVISLVSIQPFVSPELKQQIDAAIELGRREVWKKGLLRKEPNLCHGIVGNMLAHDDWGQREHFMAYAQREVIKKGIKEGVFDAGDDTHGLYWGEAGRAWGWAMMDARKDLGFPAYTDV